VRYFSLHRDSAVSVVTNSGVDLSLFTAGQGQQICVAYKTARPSMEHTEPSVALVERSCCFFVLLNRFLLTCITPLKRMGE
jgi:hypothetical protein